MNNKFGSYSYECSGCNGTYRPEAPPNAATTPPPLTHHQPATRRHFSSASPLSSTQHAHPPRPHPHLAGHRLAPAHRPRLRIPLCKNLRPSSIGAGLQAPGSGLRHRRHVRECIGTSFPPSRYRRASMAAIHADGMSSQPRRHLSTHLPAQSRPNVNASPPPLLTPTFSIPPRRKARPSTRRPKRSRLSATCSKKTLSWR